MTVRNMTLEELEMVLGWAKTEGWNPGLEDAAAFYHTDPQGFMLCETQDGRPAAAISVVNHNETESFLGLYICHPDFRGKGYGMRVWTAGLAHANGRCVGLDGVPAQVETYKKSGFRESYETVRYTGSFRPQTFDTIQLVSAEQLPAMIKSDQVYCGLKRMAFAHQWFAQSATRKTLLCTDTTDTGGMPQAFATVRRCHDGAKVGPFYAATPEQADALLAACAGAIETSRLIIDVPMFASAFARHLERLGFEASFNTTRMYTGEPIQPQAPLFMATATLELG